MPSERVEEGNASEKPSVVLISPSSLKRLAKRLKLVKPTDKSDSPKAEKVISSDEDGGGNKEESGAILEAPGSIGRSQDLADCAAAVEGVEPVRGRFRGDSSVRSKEEVWSAIPLGRFLLPSLRFLSSPPLPRLPAACVTAGCDSSRAPEATLVIRSCTAIPTRLGGNAAGNGLPALVTALLAIVEEDCACSADKAEAESTSRGVGGPGCNKYGPREDEEGALEEPLTGPPPPPTVAETEATEAGGGGGGKEVDDVAANG